MFDWAYLTNHKPQPPRTKTIRLSDSNSRSTDCEIYFSRLSNHGNDRARALAHGAARAHTYMVMCTRTEQWDALKLVNAKPLFAKFLAFSLPWKQPLRNDTHQHADRDLFLMPLRERNLSFVHVAECRAAVLWTWLQVSSITLLCCGCTAWQTILQ